MSPTGSTRSLPSGFRAKLMAAMMVMVSVVTALVLYVANRNLELSVEKSLQEQFRSELEGMQNLQQLRLAALVERCRALVRRPRIHAALEDDAIDLLYPSARDELRDIVDTGDGAGVPDPDYALRADFYRFLDRSGALIAPGPRDDVGELRPEEEAQLTLPGVSERRQIGYIGRVHRDGTDSIAEIIAMPIVSTVTGEPIAVLVIGFNAVAPVATGPDLGVVRGVWHADMLSMPGLSGLEADALARDVAIAIANSDRAGNGFARSIGGTPHQVYHNELNPDSLYPAAHEVCVYPLSDLVVRKRQLRWQVIGAGALVLLGGLGTSLLVSRRFAVPVERLEADSVRNLEGKARAEAALESTSEELQRAARFSADASHQLRTPVAVLRAGLEELQARVKASPEVNHEISSLIHQTYRLSSVIDDLLLLSRMDAGHLKLKFGLVDLSRLIEASVDDLSAQPGVSDLKIETEFPQGLKIAGDSHYAGLILQNLLENARKYNRPGGRIRLAAREENGVVHVVIGNTGRPIPVEAQGRIFERFHRGGTGENLPGYGLGLNLARELARVHQGTLRLVSSMDDWTEFELTLCVTQPGGSGKVGTA